MVASPSHIPSSNWKIQEIQSFQLGHFFFIRKKADDSIYKWQLRLNHKRNLVITHAPE
jgi:hypothetical protein